MLGSILLVNCTSTLLRLMQWYTGKSMTSLNHFKAPSEGAPRCMAYNAACCVSRRMYLMLHMCRCLTRDGSGRLQIPADVSEGRRNEAWKVFVVVACVCPPSLRERVEKAAARKVIPHVCADVCLCAVLRLAVSDDCYQQRHASGVLSRVKG